MRRIPALLLPAAMVGGYLAIVTLPAANGVPGEAGKSTSRTAMNHVSQSVQFHHYLKHPEQAPESTRRGIDAANGLRVQAKRTTALPAVAGPGLFNRDTVGLPQNEESVTACAKDPRTVVGGSNDYRGLLDPQANFTGWYLSRDGGATVTNEGLLPALSTAGQVLPSGGDPVTQSDEACNIYAGSLNYGSDPFTTGANGIGVYKTTPETLAKCPQGKDPSSLTHPTCWPKNRLVATASVAGGVGHFLDKEWLDVGISGKAGKVVWVTYSDFAQDANAPVGFTGAQIKAVRCDADLISWTAPILVSGTDADIQFSDVTISGSGATLVTWVQVEGELEQTAQTFTVKARIAQPGSTTFGPTRIVAREPNAIPFGGVLHANDFRVATVPKSIMPTVNGVERPTVVWDRCKVRVFDFTCEEPEIVLSSSTDRGKTWSAPRVISAGGDNYFPAISDETGNPDFVVAYYTNRYDPTFHNRQDVELVTVDTDTAKVMKRQRVTPISNETEADPILGGFFIGDYFDVHLLGDTAYVHYNANYRKVRLLGEGVPVPQQDNFLARVSR